MKQLVNFKNVNLVRFQISFVFAMLLVFSSCGEKEINIKIIATTDVHGKIFPVNLTEGDTSQYSLAQVYSYIKQERNVAGQKVILLDNGDILQGEPSMYYYNYVADSLPHLQSEVMNFMKYDGGCVGNHDIETGNDVFDRFNKNINFPWLAANAVDVRTGEPYFKPYVVYNVDGIKVAVLGLTTPGVENWVPEYNRKNLRFDDMIESARNWMQVIQKQEKPDFVLGLFHSGFDYKYGGGDSTSYKNENAPLLVAQAVEGFNAIVIGHDHKVYNQSVLSPSGKKVLILDPGSHGRMAAVLSMKFTKSFNSVNCDTLFADIVESKNYAPDAEFMNTFASQLNLVTQWLNAPLGTLESSIYSADAVFGPSSFMKIIHEAQLFETNADISVASNLAFNATLQTGPIALKELFKLYRYDNDLFVMNLSGKEIDGLLEYANQLRYETMTSEKSYLMKMVEGKKGKMSLKHKYYSFSEAFGIDYTVDVSKPAFEQITITGFSRGLPFYSDSVYTVAMNSYQASGGGGMLTEGAGVSSDSLKSRINKIADHDIRMIIARYIAEKKSIVPVLETNWKVVPEKWYNLAAKRDRELLYQGGNKEY